MGQFEHVLEILLLEADPFVSIDPNGTGKITEAQVGRSVTLDPRPFRPASLSPRRVPVRVLGVLTPGPSVRRLSRRAATRRGHCIGLSARSLMRGSRRSSLSSRAWASASFSSRSVSRAARAGACEATGTGGGSALQIMQARIKVISLKEGHCFAVSSSRAAHARTHAAHTHASTDARRRCLVPSLPSAFTPSAPLAIACDAHNPAVVAVPSALHRSCKPWQHERSRAPL
jgi:hypothetical protein